MGMQSSHRDAVESAGYSQQAASTPRGASNSKFNRKMDHEGNIYRISEDGASKTNDRSRNGDNEPIFGVTRSNYSRKQSIWRKVP